jgi:predicted MPP superfamily phosphohydrolase
MSIDAPNPRVAPRRHSRLRRAIFRSVEQTTAFCGGRALYRATSLAPGRLRVRDERVEVRGLPDGLHGFTIAHLSDLHGGPFLRRGDLAHVVAAVNARRPDVVVITGDFITHAWDDALPLLDDLAALRPSHGTFAVFGNHDYRGRQEGRIVAAGLERGIRFLRNECARIEARGVALVGLEDLEEARAVDVAAARANVRPGDVEILLSHNPFLFRDAETTAMLTQARCPVVLSGHTHGAQIDLPFFRRLGPPHVGTRARFGGTTLIVSRGLGVIGFPLRIRAPAEVVIVRLDRAGRASA